MLSATQYSLISAEADPEEEESVDAMHIDDGEKLLIQSSTKERTEPIPPLFVIHGALVLANVLFGSSTVVGQLGLSGTNPAFFAVLRESGAGILLFLLLMPRTGKYHQYLIGNCLL